MSFHINLIKKTECRYQGRVSMKVLALGSVSVLVGGAALVMLSVGISHATQSSSLEMVRSQLSYMEPKADVLRKKQAATQANRESLGWTGHSGGTGCPPMNGVLRSVQRHVPAQMTLTHFYAGTKAAASSESRVLRISGTANGELTAVEARHALSSDAELTRFCGEVRLTSSQRYSGEIWAFAIEGSLSAMGGTR